MLGKNIAIKGIFTTILFITIGISQVSLTIENVNTSATPGCTNSQYTTQSDCEAGDCGNDATGIPIPCLWYTGTLDIFMTNSAGCSYCPNSDYTNNTENIWDDPGTGVDGEIIPADYGKKSQCESDILGEYKPPTVIFYRFTLNFDLARKVVFRIFIIRTLDVDIRPNGA